MEANCSIDTAKKEPRRASTGCGQDVSGKRCHRSSAPVRRAIDGCSSGPRPACSRRSSQSLFDTTIVEEEFVSSGRRWITSPPNLEHARSEPSADIDAIATDLLDAAIEVHRALGPGFLEAIYEEALCLELALRSIPFVRQSSVAVHYKGRIVGDARIDLLLADRLIVELKAIEQIAPIHVAQAMSYLKATGLPLALLVNFNAPVLLRGVRRVILSPT